MEQTHSEIPVPHNDQGQFCEAYSILQARSRVHSDNILLLKAFAMAWIIFNLGLVIVSGFDFVEVYRRLYLSNQIFLGIATIIYGLVIYYANRRLPKYPIGSHVYMIDVTGYHKPWQHYIIKSGNWTTRLVSRKSLLAQIKRDTRGRKAPLEIIKTEYCEYGKGSIKIGSITIGYVYDGFADEHSLAGLSGLYSGPDDKNLTLIQRLDRDLKQSLLDSLGRSPESAQAILDKIRENSQELWERDGFYIYAAKVTIEFGGELLEAQQRQWTRHSVQKEDH